MPATHRLIPVYAARCPRSGEAPSLSTPRSALLADERNHSPVQHRRLPNTNELLQDAVGVRFANSPICKTRSPLLDLQSHLKVRRMAVQCPDSENHMISISGSGEFENHKDTGKLLNLVSLWFRSSPGTRYR